MLTDTPSPDARPYSLVYAVSSCEHPLGVHQDAPTLELAEIVQSRLPGLGMLLTLPASYDPGLDLGHSTCGVGAGSGCVEVGSGAEGLG